MRSVKNIIIRKGSVSNLSLEKLDSLYGDAVTIENITNFGVVMFGMIFVMLIVLIVGEFFGDRELNRGFLILVLVFLLSFVALYFWNSSIKEERQKIQNEIQENIASGEKKREIVEKFTIIKGVDLQEKSFFFEEEEEEEAGEKENVRVQTKNKEGYDEEKEISVKIIESETTDKMELEYYEVKERYGPYHAGIYEAKLFIPKK